MSAQSEAALIAAVHDHLDHLARLVDMGEPVAWPEELERLTDWRAKP